MILQAFLLGCIAFIGKCVSVKFEGGTKYS